MTTRYTPEARRRMAELAVSALLNTLSLAVAGGERRSLADLAAETAAIPEPAGEVTEPQEGET